jgi:uncharacterized HAD superfamily protein
MANIIAFDCDGVLLDMNAAFLLWLERQFGVVVSREDITHWDFFYTFDIPEDHFQGMWTSIWKTPLLPYPGVHLMLSKFEDMGFEIHIVSNRPESFFGAADAARRDFPQLAINPKHIHLTNNTPKSEVLNKIGAKYYVEDNPRNASEARFNSDTEVLLLERPYNKECSSIFNVYTRVKYYHDIIDFVKKKQPELREGSI